MVGCSSSNLDPQNLSDKQLCISEGYLQAKAEHGDQWSFDMLVTEGNEMARRTHHTVTIEQCNVYTKLGYKQY